MKKFRSIAEFRAYEPVLLAALTEGVHTGVKKGAHLLQQEIEVELGTYQEAIGPYEAWQDLAERTKTERVKAGYTEDDPLRASGELAGTFGSRVEGNRASVGSDDPVAIYQENGTEKIPPRSAIGGAAMRMQDKVAETIAEHAVWALRGLGPRND